MKTLLRKLLINMLLPFIKNLIIEIVTKMTNKFVEAAEDGKFTKKEAAEIKDDIIETIQTNLATLIR